MGIQKSHEQYIAEVREVHGDKYILDEVVYRDVKEKIQPICPKHGPWWITPDNFRRGHGCPGCRNESLSETRKPLTTEVFKERVKKKYGNRYLLKKVEYQGPKVKIVVRCKKHGDFSVFPQAFLLGEGCPECGDYTVKTKLTQKEFLARIPKSIKDRYDLSKVKYRGQEVPIEVVCEEHGPWITAPTRLWHNRGCPRCSYDKVGRDRALPKKEFLRRGHKHYGKDYSYKDTKYKSAADDITVWCRKHKKEFTCNAGLHVRGLAPCPQCSARNSGPQRKVQDFLQQRLGLDIEVNYKVTPELEVDIFVPPLNIAVEINGVYWHNDTRPNRGREYHIEKTLDCKRLGIQLIHIWDFEIETQWKQVEKMLTHKFGKSPNKIGARKLEVKLLTNQEQQAFFEQNHMQGATHGSVAYGLFSQKGTLLAAMSFGKPRFSTKAEWELIRFATKGGGTVQGGASRLLKTFERNHTPKSLVSYANLRWSQGNLYKQLGFKFQNRSNPNYFYFQGSTRVSRYAAQKHRLASFLEVFDPNLTEEGNMRANGFLRVWDCGNLVFIKTFEPS